MTTLTLEAEVLQEEVIRELETLEALVLSDLLGLYIREAAMHLDALSSAFDRDDAATLGAVAHTLKGSSSSLGALLVTQSADAIVTAARTGDLQDGFELIEALKHALEITDQAFRERSAGSR